MLCQLSECNGLNVYSPQIIIPKGLNVEILVWIHEGHPELAKCCESLALRMVFWHRCKYETEGKSL